MRHRVYARVMKFFVITICLMFLFVSLYLDIWKYFIQDEKMWVGSESGAHTVAGQYVPGDLY